MKKFLMSFAFAWRGIKDGFEQRNMRVHVFIATVVVVMGFWLRISVLEWVLVIILTALVWAAELFNTAIENEANIMRDELGAPYALMGRAKDLSAGAVLIIAIAAAIVGLVIFIPRILYVLASP